jgi:hypothetical protein
MSDAAHPRPVLHTIEGELVVVNRFRDGLKLRVTTQAILAIELAFGTIGAVLKDQGHPSMLLLSN